jgi:hypothetical protein
MASTKRKRKTKHRGNAVGTVEARGRTSKPSEAQKKTATKATTRGGRGGADQRPHRLDNPPTWKGSARRALMLGAFYTVILLVVSRKNPTAAVITGVFGFLVFIPVMYYTDLFTHRRRMANKARGQQGKR